ncbi:MAG: tetratricopeptide repeat protein [Spirochaetaceae bacterium]|nr:tetratricopeptide repeat protein [Myxococcales bacterium]MCB9722979.1 tetratricopeptide repeat protein [Spirochaetaceae bacterium]
MAWGRRGAATRQAEIERALRRALRAAVAGDWPAAETWLERLVEADSADLDAYHALARLYRDQGAIGRAIRMHQNLLLRGDLTTDQRGEALVELARDFEAGGFRERAIASYEEALATSPRDAGLLARLVSLWHGQGDFERALVLLRRLRRRDRPEADRLESRILLDQARTRADEGDHDGARQALKRCLRRDAGCAAAWAMMGELEAERGRDARALKAWTRAVASDGDLGATLYPKIGATFAARGKSEGYEAYLRDRLEARPTDRATRLALARALVARGDERAARELLARGVERTPEQLTLHVELGRLLIASGQEAESLKAYASLLDALANEPSQGGAGEAGGRGPGGEARS